MGTTRTAKKGSYHHGNLREALKAAAMKLVAERGVAGFTLREAARRAGVTHAAPYRHFEDKQALLADIAADGFDELAASVTRAAEQAGKDPLARLLAMAPAYVRFAVEHPTYFRLMWGAEAPDKDVYPNLAEADKSTFEVLVAAIRGAQEKRQIIRGDVRDLALASWCFVHGFSHAIVGRDMERRGVPDEAVDEYNARGALVFLQGILPR